MDADVAELLHSLEEGKARRLLEGLGQRAALRELNRHWAVRYAVDLLRQQVERPQIRDRLMQRYGLERAAAYMRIDEALKIYCRPVQVSKSEGEKWTPLREDEISDTPAEGRT